MLLCGTYDTKCNRTLPVEMCLYSFVYVREVYVSYYNLEGRPGLNKSHTFLVDTREWLEEQRKPVASARATWNWTLIVLFESAYK